VSLTDFLEWLGSFLVVVGFLTTGAALQEWRLWRKETGMAADDDKLFTEAVRKYGWILVLVAAVLMIAANAWARDAGQWEAADPAIRNWYQSLMRPDAPSASCCGEADAYWADEVHVKDGKTFATITDDRPDEPLGRPHIDVGTVIEIPPEKLKWDRSNPTGHGVLFVSKGLYAWCFVQGSGI
jgi:hypothetical protein